MPKRRLGSRPLCRVLVQQTKVQVDLAELNNSLHVQTPPAAPSPLGAQSVAEASCLKADPAFASPNDIRVSSVTCGDQLGSEQLREQHDKNWNHTHTNFHHDLLCFSLKRASRSALKTGVSFRVMRHNDSPRPEHAEVHSQKAANNDGTSKGPSGSQPLRHEE